MAQELKKKIEEKNRVLKSAKKLFDARDDAIDIFEKGTFPYKDNVFKTKQKRIEKGKKQKKFLNMLRMNQRILTMICLNNILILKYLLFQQKNYMRQKTKRKMMTQQN